jgi:hypothetical protein
MPFMEAEDEMGAMQCICSDQLETSACDDVENLMADINDNVPEMCSVLDPGMMGPASEPWDLAMGSAAEPEPSTCPPYWCTTK